MAKNKKNIIWTSDYDMNEMKNDFNDYCAENDLDPAKIDFYDWCSEENHIWLENEMTNLDIPCGKIIAIADLGFWFGRRSGYKLIEKNNINGIFDCARNGDYGLAEFYCDGRDCRAELVHHDGTHYLLLREVKDGAPLDRLCQALYNDGENREKLIKRYTRSLKPRIAQVYGW